MNKHPRILASLKREWGHSGAWLSRGLVMAYAALVGVVVVGFTRLTEWTLALFFHWQGAMPLLPLVWTPLCTVAIVWATRRWAAGSAGSGIPQVMAALEPQVDPQTVSLFVSMRLAVAKIVLTSLGLLAGLSLGREGPSVQIGASLMHNARRWLPRRPVVPDHALLVAGGAAGIAAAFNTPLAGVMFAIEELSRNPEQRRSGLTISAIVLSGVVAISLSGNSTYFGTLRISDFGLALVLPGLLVALGSGVAGGLFSRLLIAAVGGQGTDPMSRLRARHPILFAGLCGLLVAALGVVSGGAVFGSGYAHTREMLNGQGGEPAVYVLFKILATWLTTWSGVPGGVFAPCLAIGGALGNDAATLLHYPHAPTLMALGMAGFLAAVTQAPLTSFIIVMEMIDNHQMVLSLMACAFVASLVSRILSRSFYGALSQFQLDRLPPP
ncbi:MAG: chloride channel protein [Burkholderiaceae bacterium]|nr:chloride channel protein [Roseateles sp.]MBV8470452.1 chloride channel protein [Burkholderiaceae bacterium]